MIEFVIFLGITGGWIIFGTTLILMLVFGKIWGLLGLALLIAGIELNKFLKRKYTGVIVSNSPRAREIARHIFEMNELIILSSYPAALFLYSLIQKYIEVRIMIPGG